MNPWNLISPAEALRRAVVCAARLHKKTEEVSLRDALGRIAAVDVVNGEDSPPFNRSTVDGYALRSADTQGASAASPANVRVIGEVRMGKATAMNVGLGQAVRIPTGGMLPVGADAVVMQEWTHRDDDGNLQVMRPVNNAENTILRGDDAPAGMRVLASGCRIGVPDIGILAACGAEKITVAKKPLVTIVTTGDEIVPPGVVPELGQIRDVNSFTLCALAESAGCEAYLAKRVPDSAENLRLILQAAMQESDVVLVSGGSSVGDRDFTTTVVQELPDVQILFHGIAWKPGKPTLMAIAGQTVVFGLPGHTVAAMTVFQELVAPFLYACQGAEPGMSKFVVEAELGAPLRPDRERDEIIRVRLEPGNDKVAAWPLPAKSGLITTMSRAHGIVHTKAGQEPLQAGDKIQVQIIMDRVDGVWQGVAR